MTQPLGSAAAPLSHSRHGTKHSPSTAQCTMTITCTSPRKMDSMLQAQDATTLGGGYWFITCAYAYQIQLHHYSWHGSQPYFCRVCTLNSPTLQTTWQSGFNPVPSDCSLAFACSGNSPGPLLSVPPSSAPLSTSASANAIAISAYCFSPSSCSRRFQGCSHFHQGFNLPFSRIYSDRPYQLGACFSSPTCPCYSDHAHWSWWPNDASW